ncbi:hypothetical protein [Legionella hackeliae]|uniref:Coiled-coil protein n=1 Tax=Legionella hackeliae TaxID=449 RepID=A0A0A8UNX0_LEGHA|nr:hypothetical protein [Legionella hackeliae]KTD13849.1 ninein [Legionella hackeliae]CEK10550.1 protein of unknown function [Legionella hackeliae]STX47289.1 ninein [Legionella hackeliae]
MKPEDLQQLLSTHDSLLQGHRNVLGKHSRWNINDLIHRPPSKELKPFEATWQTTAQTADSQTLKSIEQLQLLIEKHATKGRYNDSLLVVNKLLKSLKGEKELLENAFSSDVLTKKPKHIPTQAEFLETLHKLYNEELSLRLNISTYYAILGAVINGLKHFLPIPKDIDASALDSICEQVSSAQTQLKQALVDYAEIKVIVRNHLADIEPQLATQDKTASTSEASESVRSENSESGANDSNKGPHASYKAFAKKNSRPRNSLSLLKSELDIASSEGSLSSVKEVEALDTEEDTYTQATGSTITDSTSTKETKAQKTEGQIRFEVALAALAVKVADLHRRAETNSHYKDAKEKSWILYQTLVEAHRDFHIEKTLTVDAFKKQCNDAIVNARPVLAKHRGWTETLLNMAYIVLSVASFGTANVISYLATDKWRFLPTAKNTDSETKLDQFAAVLQTLS